MTIRPSWRSRPIVLLVLCGFVLCGTIAIGTVAVLSNLYDRVLADKERELRNFASVVAGHLDQMLQSVSLAETGLIEKIRARGIASVEDFEKQLSSHDVYLMLTDRLEGLPQAAAFSLISARGKTVNHTRSWPPLDLDASNREFFQVLKSNPRITSYVTGPLRNWANGRWTIHVVQKVAGPSGEFLGLLLGAIELEYFERYFATLSLGEGSVFSFTQRDGTVLARYPHVEGATGKSYGPYALFKDVLSRSDAGVARLTSSIDGQERLIAGQELANYPAVVGVGVTIASVLAEWRNGAIYLAGAGILIALVIGGVIFLAARQTEKQLSANTAQLDIALSNMSQGLVLFDAGGCMVFCNGRYLEMYGVSRESAQPGCAVSHLLRERQRAGTFRGDPAQFAREIMDSVARRSLTKSINELADGRVISVIRRPLPNGGWVVTHEDITEQRQAERDRDRNRAFLNTVLENVPTAIIVKDACNRRYVLINRAFEEIYGISRQEVIGKTAHDVFAPQEAARIAADEERLLRFGSLSAELAVNTRGKGTRSVTVTRAVIRDDNGEPRYLLGVVDDITEQRQSEQLIAHMAHHDALTGLSNRTQLCLELDQALGRVQRGERLALLYLDLDHFKRVNDTLGHLLGDELLKAVANRLRDCVREADLIARLGGDEFAIVQTSLEQASDAAALASRIGSAIKAPYDLDGHEAIVDVSIGIAVAPNDGSERVQLMKNADMALYEAKGSGRGIYHFYEPEMDARIKARQQLDLDLRNALNAGQFELYYQPIVNLESFQVSGCEALLRWHHPERGMVGPNEFIPLAEENGLIVPIGEWVLRRACADAATWPDDIRVAVNLSPIQLKGGKIVQTVIGALASAGLAADRLDLEITESVLMQNTFATLATLHQLRDLGVHVSLDDFGTGYSSLSYLRSFPFGRIKIDRSFIEDISEEDDCAAIVQAVTSMARRLNMTTVAEGIETEAQRERVRELGCIEMQGYLFSRPLPVANVVRLFGDRVEKVVNAA